MEAAVYREMGSPDVFRYEEVPDPVAGPSEILIKAKAISIEIAKGLSWAVCGPGGTCPCRRRVSC